MGKRKYYILSNSCILWLILSRDFRFSVETPKTTLANFKRHKRFNGPIKPRRKYMKRGKTCASQSQSKCLYCRIAFSHAVCICLEDNSYSPIRCFISSCKKRLGKNWGSCSYYCGKWCRGGGSSIYDDTGLIAIVSCNDFFHKIAFQSKCNCVTLLSYLFCVTEKQQVVFVLHNIPNDRKII